MAPLLAVKRQPGLKAEVGSSFQKFDQKPQPISGYELFREQKRTEASSRDTGAMAICKIKYMLRQENAQLDGQPCTIEDWDANFKPVLGSYKKFLLSRPDQFRIIEGDEPGLYTVEVVVNKPVVAPSWEDIAAIKGKSKGKGKFGKSGKDGSMPAPFGIANKGKDGKGKDGKWGKGKDKGWGKDGKNSFGKGFGKDAKGKSKKGGKAEGTPVSTMTPLAQRVLAEKAIREIKDALRHSGDGTSHMPKDWIKRYAPILGPYVDFLLSRSDHFCLVEGRAGSYTLELASGDSGDAPARATKAVRKLAQAAEEELAVEGVAEAAEEADLEAEPGLEEEAVEAEDDAGEANLEDEGEVDADPYGELAFDEEMAEELGEDELAAMADDVGEEPEFPAEQPTRHGSYMSLLSDSFLSAKRPRFG